MGNITSAGSQLVTADAVVGISGSAITVFGIHIYSGGGGAGVVLLRNGTSTGGTIYASEEGTTSKGKTIVYPTQGFYFPAGCFADIDANVTSVLITYSVG